MNWPRSWGPLEIAEYRIVLATLKHFNGNIRQAAFALKRSYRFMNYYLKKCEALGLSTGERQRNRNKK